MKVTDVVLALIPILIVAAVLLAYAATTLSFNPVKP